MAIGAGCVQTVGTGGSPTDELTDQTAAAFSTGTYYSFLSATSLKCLDDSNGNGYGPYAQQWTCMGNGNQQWQLISLGSVYYQIQDMGSGQCLDNGGTTTWGAQMNIWACDSNNINQSWKVVQQWTQLPHGGAWVAGSQYAIVSKMSGLCLDNTGSGSNGAPATQWQCSNPAGSTNDQNLTNSNQLWSLMTPSAVHPGVVNTTTMLGYVKNNLGNSPW